MKGWRPYILLFLFLVLTATVVGRLVFLQIKKHDFYKALCEGEQKILKSVQGQRGEIFFRNGDPMAINRTVKYVFISPREIELKKETAEKVSRILSVSYDEIYPKTKKDGFFEIVKTDITEEEESRLRQASLTGVHIEERKERFYPQKEVAAHITGFVGGENRGQYGLEGFYDQLLTGQRVISQKEKGPFGFFENAPVRDSGQDLHTTIDPSIQFAAYKILAENQEELGYRSGQIIVVDPLSGEILALAQFPSFDPNSYSEEELDIFQNNLIQKTYEPGSAFKPLTMAAALNEKRITPETTYVDKGILEIGGHTIHNYDNRVWGESTMTKVLERSINTGAVFAEKKLGHTQFLRYIRRFGLFEKTGVDLQGEIYSKNEEFRKGYEINFATGAFGQGINITPIQLVRAFTAFANGGRMVTLHTLEKAEPGKEGFEVYKKEEEVISEKTATQITNMLVSVVENGYAKGAQVRGYHIAGKTGTAQIPWGALGIAKKGYSEETIQTFIGFGPAYDPRFLAMIKLDAPRTKTAEYSAVPLFKNLAGYIINLWEIPPTKNVESEQ